VTGTCGEGGHAVALPEVEAWNVAYSRSPGSVIPICGGVPMLVPITARPAMPSHARCSSMALARCVTGASRTGVSCLRHDPTDRGDHSEPANLTAVQS
jgi:hypothetical protein